MQTFVEKMIEKAASDIVVRTARIGHAGWKDRAMEKARAEARERADAWLQAGAELSRREAARAMRAKEAAEQAKLDAEGLVKLEHGPYGYSYFGSGGAWGTVHLTNAEVHEVADSGFIKGPAVIKVLDRSQVATVRAKGGDAIGIDNDRRWSESWNWDPVAQAWRRL